MNGKVKKSLDERIKKAELDRIKAETAKLDFDLTQLVPGGNHANRFEQ